MSVCCLMFFRVQSKVFSLCVYREGDWLQLEGGRAKYDSINTFVMLYAMAGGGDPGVTNQKVCVL